MVLLDAQTPPPPNPWQKRILAATALLAVVGGILYWQFRFYPEKRRVAEFMDALVAGHYEQAYRLWSPSSSYRFPDFLEDWGEISPWGRIHSYQILGIEPQRRTVLHVPREGGGRRTLELSPDRSGVVVLVRINQRAEPARIWVEKKDKSLSFPPF